MNGEPTDGRSSDDSAGLAVTASFRGIDLSKSPEFAAKTRHYRCGAALALESSAFAEIQQKTGHIRG